MMIKFHINFDIFRDSLNILLHILLLTLMSKFTLFMMSMMSQYLSPVLNMFSNEMVGPEKWYVLDTSFVMIINFFQLQECAAQCNPIHQANYIEKLSSWSVNQLIFVDELATNEHTCNQKYGWASRGVMPYEYRLFKCSEHWSILPAYTVDDFITWEIIQGAFTTELFEEFIEFKVLP